MLGVPRLDLLQQEKLHTRDYRDRLLQRLRLRHQACKENREIPPLIAALMKYWRRVEFIAFPVGHEGTTSYLTAAFSTVRPHVEQARASMGVIDPATDHNARIHDYILLKSEMESLTDLAQSRLLDIISNRKRPVDALPREASCHRAYSVASSSPTLAARQQGAATDTHKMRTTRVPESTAIT
jgi:hypothetical protein